MWIDSASSMQFYKTIVIKGCMLHFDAEAEARSSHFEKNLNAIHLARSHRTRIWIGSSTLPARHMGGRVSRALQLCARMRPYAMLVVLNPHSCGATLSPAPLPPVLRRRPEASSSLSTTNTVPMLVYTRTKQS